MSLGLAFWIAMFVWLIFGLWSNWPVPAGGGVKVFGGHLLLFILFILLGWKVFGAPLHS